MTEGGNWTFTDKGKLEEFVSSRTKLKRMAKGNYLSRKKIK